MTLCLGRLPFFNLWLIVCFTAATANAQSDQLFNGKDLSGFKVLNGKAKWEVSNGMIVGTTVFGEANSFLATDKVYGDFILDLDVMVDGDMNSGIQFRSEVKDANDTCHLTDNRTPNRVHGYQVEIDPSSRAWSGGVYDEARRGWLYPMEYNPAAKTAFKYKQWNHYKIECIGTNIRTWLNGIPCAYVVDDMTPKGFIALQVHQIERKEEEGEKIFWKNIRLQTTNLKAAPVANIFVANLIPNNLSEVEKTQGYKLLWDGKSFAGWRGPNGKSFPENLWYIQNGTLNVRNSNKPNVSLGGDILSNESFSAFDLQFEFQLSDTANSGVKYFVTETNGQVLGLEYQLLDDQKHPDAKLGAVGNRTNGSLYDLIPRLKIGGGAGRETLPIGEWNRGRIIAYPDGRIEHWLNGWKIVDYQRGTPIYNALVARSKYAHYDGFGMVDKGPILLQEHGSHVAFRSIKIKDLSNK